MGDDGARPQHPVAVEAVNGAQAVLAQRTLLVGAALGGVDMEAHVVGFGGAALVQRGVGQGQRGVEAEQSRQLRAALAPTAFDEASVLADARLGAFGAVTVSYLVAQAGAQPGLTHGVGDDVQRAVHRVGAGVVVYESCRATAHRVHQAGHRAPVDIVQGERLVQGPPQAGQDFGEVAGGGAGDGEAARIGAVEVGVGADVPWQDELAAHV